MLRLLAAPKRAKKSWPRVQPSGVIPAVVVVLRDGDGWSLIRAASDLMTAGEVEDAKEVFEEEWGRMKFEVEEVP
jgi:hypothetical protein